MILNKEVEITLNAANFKHFKSLGYLNLKSGNKLRVPVEHLNKGSHKMIEVECDICFKHSVIVYEDYLRTIKKYNFYTCSKCATIKARRTNLENHNDENYCNKEKIKQTKLLKYNDENYCNKEKITRTFLHRYGVQNIMHSETFFEKQQKNSYLLKKHDKFDLYLFLIDKNYDELKNKLKIIKKYAN